MPAALHRFEYGGRRYLVDPETCFCVECDAISWDVSEHYPTAPVNQILHLLEGTHPRQELDEVISELEWLRATNAILKRPTLQELEAGYTVEQGLEEVTIFTPKGDLQAVLGAGHLLLAGAAAKRPLTLTLCLENLEAVSQAFVVGLAGLFRAATVAQKHLTIVFRCGPLSEGGAGGHDACFTYGVTSAAMAEATPALFAKLARSPYKKWPQRLQEHENGGRGGIYLVPHTPDFTAALQTWQEMGFTRIVLDLEEALSRPGHSHEAWMTGLREAATFYAKHLIRRKYFRLEPIATLFKQIYDGKPIPRSDPAGTHALAIDAMGGIYPAPAFARQGVLRLGTMEQGIEDHRLRAQFENVGSKTTAVCMGCWARNYCGGGPAAVHHALTGNFRTPDPAWCDAQRDWIASAIAAFNILTSEGVQFDRLYGILDRPQKIGLWDMAKAVVRKQAAIRPIEEADAPLLARWENWSTAAYFLLKQNGMFMATTYDREMDAIHPMPYEQEWMLLDHQGAAKGVLRLRPDAEHSLAWLYVYAGDQALYEDTAYQRSLRATLADLFKQSQIGRVVTPVGPWDTGLSTLLLGLGFTPCGVQRDALFVHGAYHDVTCYAYGG